MAVELERIALLGGVFLVLACSSREESGDASDGAATTAEVGGSGGVSVLVGGNSGAGGAATDAGGRGGATGSVENCDCGDLKKPMLSLDCACRQGFCSTFKEDLATYVATDVRPYCIVLGICAGGLRTLTYEWATEQKLSRTYDSKGALMYSRLLGYFTTPAACGLETHGDTLGTLTIGSENPASDCSYCLVASDDLLPAGTGANAGQHYYQGSRYEACEPKLLE
jgi:hypothetical protein